MLKRIIIALAVLLILLVGAIVILPGLVPTDAYRERLEADLSRVFARDVKISGDIKITTFPVLKIDTGAVSLANPEGFPEGQFINVDAMSAKVRLLPLLSKSVEISGVTLKSPVIRLEKQADGSVNWMGKESEEKPENEVDSGPFKRDGRFTEYDPSLNLLKIENGDLQYKDATSDQIIKVENVNLDLRAPGLNKPLSLNGEFVYDGLKTDIDAGIDSPEAFLKGLATGFSADVKTPEGTVDVKGQFLPGEDIAATASFDASTQSPRALAARLPVPEDLTLPPLSSLSVKGDVTYAPGVTKLSKLDFATEGEGLNVTYKGSVDASGDIAAIGDFTANLSDLSILDPYLEEPIEGLNLISTVTSKGKINYAPDAIKLPALEFAAIGNGVEASFDGAVDLSEGASSAGAFTAKLDDIKLIDSFLDEPVEALNVVSSVNAQGNVEWSGKRYSVTNLQSNVAGSDLTASFNGNATFNEALSLNGSFDGQTADIPALLEKAGLSQPDAAALKRLTAKGQVAFAGGKAQISNLSAQASEGLLNGQYNGDLNYGETIGLSGQFSGEISDMQALTAAISREIPYSDIIKRVTISSQIQSQGKNHTLSNLDAKLLDGLLNGNFAGNLTVGEASNISGALNVSAASLRNIALAQEVDLPPSTDLGPIFGNFVLSGQVSGTPQNMTFTSGAIELDALSGRGDFGLEMRGAKPRLKGNIAFSRLDFRPYTSAWSEQNPTGELMPWSEAPIALTGLDSIDANIGITTPAIIMDRIELGQTSGNVTLSNGTLSADLRQMQLYDGNASGKFSLSARNGVPAISIDTTINAVTAQEFFAATGGFDKVQGTNDFAVSLTGGGQSQAAIMKSLNGGGTFKITNGKILGLDVGGLVSGVDSALTTRTLPTNTGLGGSTDFRDLDSSFTLNNGRATLNGFQLEAGTFFMDADGYIDIGQQYIDIGIRPKVTGGSQVADFGIPMRFKGKFGQAKPGLDSSFLTNIATAKARAKASSLVRDQLGDSPVGNILGSVIGGNSAGSTSTTTAPSAGNILGGLLGGTTSPRTQSPAQGTTTPQQEPAPAAPSPEEEIGNALKGLFGKKKKKKE